MDYRDCLAHYPFVVVRIACRVCSPEGPIVSLDWLRNTDRRSAFATSRIVSHAFGGPRRGQRRASRRAASTCRTLSSRGRRTRRRGWSSCGWSRKNDGYDSAPGVRVLGMVAREKHEPPMTLRTCARMASTCQTCGHEADVNLDTLPETIAVPQIGRRLRCSECGGKRIDTRPAWHTAAIR